MAGLTFTRGKRLQVGIKTTIVRAGKRFDAEPCTELSESLAVLPLRLETLENRNQHGHDLVVGYVVLEFEVESVANRAPTQEDRVGSGSGLAIGPDVGGAADQADVGVVRTSTAVGAASHPDGQTFLGKAGQAIAQRRTFEIRSTVAMPYSSSQALIS